MDTDMDMDGEMKDEDDDDDGGFGLDDEVCENSLFFCCAQVSVISSEAITRSHRFSAV